MIGEPVADVKEALRRAFSQYLGDRVGTQEEEGGDGNDGGEYLYAEEKALFEEGDYVVKALFRVVDDGAGGEDDERRAADERGGVAAFDTLCIIAAMMQQKVTGTPTAKYTAQGL